MSSRVLTIIPMTMMKNEDDKTQDEEERMGRSATLGRRVGERYTNHQVGNDCLMIIMVMTIIMVIMMIIILVIESTF